MLRPSRAAAMSGDSGAENCQGEMRVSASTLIGSSSASSNMPGSLIADVAMSKPLTIGFQRVHRLSRSAASGGSRPAVTKVLPISVPVAVTK